MRKIILILLSAFAMTANAQDFLPVLTEGKTWHMLYVHGYDSNTYTWTVDGDTIVGERNCKRVQYNTSGNYEAAFEEDGRLYCFGPEPGDFESTVYTCPELICDFNLKAGDEAWYSTVTRVDTIEVRGIKRRRIVLGSGSDVWVEGIGANHDGWPTSRPVPTAGHAEESIDSVYENGVLVFTRDDFFAPAVSTGIQQTVVAPARSGQKYDLTGKAIPAARKNEIYIEDGRKHLDR